jgi:hypothetical protein
MELVASDIDEFAGRGIPSGVHRVGNGLRDQSEQQQSRKDQTKYGQEAQEALSDRARWS